MCIYIFSDFIKQCSLRSVNRRVEKETVNAVQLLQVCWAPAHTCPGPGRGDSRLRPRVGWGGRGGRGQKTLAGLSGDTSHTLLTVLLNDPACNDMLTCEAGTASQSIPVIKM